MHKLLMFCLLITLNIYFFICSKTVSLEAEEEVAEDGGCSDDLSSQE